jgi:hypothetical protein
MTGYSQKVCEPPPRIPMWRISHWFDPPDEIVAASAVEFVTLVESFDANTAERNLRKAILMANPPKDLETKLNSERQMYVGQNRDPQNLFVDLAAVSVRHENSEMIVDIHGLLKKTNSSKLAEVQPVHYVVRTTWVPHSPTNPFGVAVLDYTRVE